MSQDLKSAISPDADDEKLTSQQFDFIRSFLHETSGISLADNKINMVHNRIKKRRLELGFTCFDEYLSHLNANHGGDETVHLVNALTTNVTHFFREEHHFQHLKKALKERIRDGQKKITIWSAACSIGAEPYSAAIAVEEALKEEPSACEIKILATDIDTLALARGRKGEYLKKESKGLSPANIKTHFTIQKNEEGDIYKVREKIRKRISFNYFNLNDPVWPMSGPFDFIFCRNVLIYFESDKQQEYMKKITQLLRPDGLLYLGHSEYFVSDDENYKSLGQTIFQKK